MSSEEASSEEATEAESEEASSEEETEAETEEDIDGTGFKIGMVTDVGGVMMVPSTSPHGKAYREQARHSAVKLSILSLRVMQIMFRISRAS